VINYYEHGRPACEGSWPTSSKKVICSLTCRSIPLDEQELMRHGSACKRLQSATSQ